MIASIETASEFDAESPNTIISLLNEYLLRNELRDSTVQFYRRTVGVFCLWYGGTVPLNVITADLINQFLVDKKDAGTSGHYRRSLRNGLVAILGRRIDTRDLRSVRLPALDVKTWTPEEVARLAECCSVLPFYLQNYFRLAIALAYHTGLSQIDLHRLTRKHISTDGVVRIRRSKTDVAVTTFIPPDLMAKLPDVDENTPIVPEKFTGQMFRVHFGKVVRAAGLVGTFKTLRSSSGTAAELLTGKGHEHLGNSRVIFQKHYLDNSKLPHEPVRFATVIPAESIEQDPPKRCGKDRMIREPKPLPPGKVADNRQERLLEIIRKRTARYSDLKAAQKLLGLSQNEFAAELRVTTRGMKKIYTRSTPRALTQHLSSRLRVVITQRLKGEADGVVFLSDKDLLD